MTADAAARVRNPFPGLRPFQENEDHLFFGRESQVDRMVDKLAAERFLAVVGTSGAGKSSLVNCGLRPALRRGLMASAGTVWQMVQFRPGADPVRAMSYAIAGEESLFGRFRPSGLPLEDMVEATLRMSDLGLADVFGQAQSDIRSNVLVVVDQFEELFRFGKLLGKERGEAQERSAEAAAFVKLLLQARAQTDIPLYVVLTMRSDFLGDCAWFEGLPEAINLGQYLVPRLTRDERRSAIAGPVAVAGGEISPILLTRLVNDVGENPDQLSILQHALYRTWAHWERETARTEPLAISDYEAIGTIAHALDRHAELAWSELRTDRERKICERLFKTLTDKGHDNRGVRRPTRFSNLCRIANAESDEVRRVIEVFRDPSRSFLMPPYPEPLLDDTTVDISHESLMRVWERLNNWADEERESARMYNRLSETAALHERGEAGVWRNPDLAVALEWERRNEPTPSWAALYGDGYDAAMSFLQKSKAARMAVLAEKEFARRWRTRRNVLAGITLFFFMYLLDPVSRPIVTFTHGFGADALVISFAAEVCGLLCLAGYGALAMILKWVYRQVAFERITAEVAAWATAAAQRELVFAGFSRRAMAFGIDLALFFLVLLPLMFWAFIANLGGGAMNFGMNSLPYPNRLLSTRVAAGLPFAFITIGQIAYLAVLAVFPLDWLYHAAMTSSRWRATVGKHAVGIVVTGLSGERLSFRHASLRYFAKALSWLSLGYGFLCQPFDERGQALHDRVGRTLVLRQTRRPDEI